MDRPNNDPQAKEMMEGRIFPLILRFAAPTTVGMTVISLYSLSDALFVSSLGTEAGAAVGVTFAIQALLQAVGYTFGMGSGSLVSRRLGSRREREASQYATVAIVCSLLIGVAIMLIGFIFGAPLIRFLGAGESIYPYAMSYSRFLFFSAPFTCATFVLSQLLRAEGKVLWSTVGLVVGSLLNIFLDPILITRLGMGISGASLATLISQTVSSAILFSAYVFRKSRLSLLCGFTLRDLSALPKILLVGLPSFFRPGLTVLATILLNHSALMLGDAAVEAISVVTRLFLLAFSLCLGVGQGMMPVTGYNRGCGRQDRILKAYLISTLLASVLMLTVSIPLIIFAPQLIAFFRNDPNVIAIGVKALRAQSIVLIFHGTITCTIMLLQSIGHNLGATVLACARQGLFFVPLIMLMPRWFGTESIIYVQPLADLLSFLLALPFFIGMTRSLKQKITEQP